MCAYELRRWYYGYRREHGECGACRQPGYRFKRDQGWRLCAGGYGQRGTIGVDLNADHLAVAEHQMAAKLRECLAGPAALSTQVSEVAGQGLARRPAPTSSSWWVQPVVDETAGSKPAWVWSHRQWRSGRLHHYLQGSVVWPRVDVLQAIWDAACSATPACGCGSNTRGGLSGDQFGVAAGLPGQSVTASTWSSRPGLRRWKPTVLAAMRWSGTGKARSRFLWAGGWLPVCVGHSCR